MAKTSYNTIPPGFDLLYEKALVSGDRYIIPRVRVHRQFYSRSHKKGISQRSLLPELSIVWNTFPPTTRDEWELAAVESGLTGFKLFVQDTAKRRANGLPGYASPNVTYQASVGRMLVASPAEGLLIEQLHPFSYYIYSKVRGTRSKYAPKQVFELFDLPFTIECSYKTDLTSLSGDARARMYAIIYSTYQGRNIETLLEIPFGLSDDWQRASATVPTVVGQPRGYTLFFEIHQARGNLYFDNVVAYHGAQNWARDPHCNRVSTSFTRAYYQVARNWVSETLPNGTEYGSYYFNP